MARGRTLPPLALADGQREQLASISSSTSMPPGLAPERAARRGKAGGRGRLRPLGIRLPGGSKKDADKGSRKEAY